MSNPNDDEPDDDLEDDDDLDDLGIEPYDAEKEPDAEKWQEIDPQVQLTAIEHYHRRFKGTHPPYESVTAHAIGHSVIENQLAANDPPATRATLDRLRREGLSRHEAIHAIASVMFKQLFR